MVRRRLTCQQRCKKRPPPAGVGRIRGHGAPHWPHAHRGRVRAGSNRILRNAHARAIRTLTKRRTKLHAAHGLDFGPTTTSRCVIGSSNSRHHMKEIIMNALFRQRRVALSAVVALVCAGCASHESTVPPTVVTTADHSEATLSTPLERAAEW